LPTDDFFARDILAGMDTSQMEESLCEPDWTHDEEYSPFSNGNVSLE
jgi:hypothetical protein